MTGLKLTGVLMMVAAGLGTGALLLQRRRLQWAALWQTQRLLEYILDAVQYQTLPGDVIVQRLKTRPGLELYQLSGCLHLDQLTMPAICPAQQRRLFDECFALLGHTGSEELCRLVSRYLALCQSACQEALLRYRQAQRLFVPLCGGLAAILAILFL